MNDLLGFMNHAEAKAILAQAAIHQWTPQMVADAFIMAKNGFFNTNGDVSSTSLGYQYTIQTTTQIRARTIVQKFYEVAPSDFMSVIPGNGAFLEDIKTNTTFQLASSFETGLQSLASGPTQISNVDIGTSPVTTKIHTWVGGYTWSNMELAKALAANNFNVQEGKLAALKKQWDLGIQKTAFLGLLGDLTNTPGLLTNSQVNIDTTTITTPISEMTATEFQAFIAEILAVFYANSNSTALPNTFVMPMNDFLGLGAAPSSDFPIGFNKFEYMERTFKQLSGNANFQIKGLAYSQAANNVGYTSVGGKNRYVLYNNVPDTIVMDMPLPFSLMSPGTGNNFNWNGVAYGQFTGTTLFRPAECLYLDQN